MYPPSYLTWFLIIFGLLTCLPLFLAQLVFLINPKGKRAREVLIGKSEDWRDKTHFKMAYGAAIADWFVFFPIMITSIIGMLLAEAWGYMLFAVSGAVCLYINLILWFTEKEYVYPSRGPLRYYTYYWGNFMYWGFAALIYGLYRIL